MLVIYQSIPKRMITYNSSKLGKYQKTGYLIKSLWQSRTKLFDLHGFTISHHPRSYVWTLTQRSYIVLCMQVKNNILWMSWSFVFCIIYKYVNFNRAFGFLFSNHWMHRFFLSSPNIWSHVFMLSWYHDQRMNLLQSLQWLIN